MAKAPVDLSERALFDRCATVPESGCWIWLGQRDEKGYGVVPLGVRGKKLVASRAMYAAVNGAIPHGMFVCHKCDTPSCVNPGHLFLGTPRDNVDDMVRKGRARKARGVMNSNCKLTEAQVLLAFSDPRTCYETAETYGVKESTICDLRNGRTWAHITGVKRK